MDARQLRARIDFDIDKTLRNLNELQAELPVGGGRQSRSLLYQLPDGTLQVLPLAEAKQLVDHIWTTPLFMPTQQLDIIIISNRFFVLVSHDIFFIHSLQARMLGFSFYPA